MNTIRTDMADADYRAFQGVSISALKRITQSPAHYKWHLDHPQEQTPAMLLGTLTHLAVFQPELLPGKYAVKPDGMSFATKEGKLWRDSQTGPIISYEDSLALDGMATSVKNNPTVSNWLLRGNPEVSLFADHDNGLQMKGRVDWMLRDEPVLLDLKTCEDASAFEREAAQRQYHLQEAYYRQLCALNDVPVERFVFVVVEKNPPYGVRLVEYDTEAMVIAQAVNEDNLKTLDRCLRSGEWPGYRATPEKIKLPKWVRMEAELLV